jgi:CHAT domain-containing protein/tetratricopeptide (TPR) repeat protein
MAIFVLFLLLQSAANAAEVPDCHQLEEKGQLDDAVTCYEQLLAVETADRFAVHMRIGWIRAGNADYESSLAQFRDALAIGRTLGDRSREATAINALGFVHQQLRDYPAALDHFRRAYALASELGDRKLIGEVLYSQGRLALWRGDDAEAARTLHESLQARHEAGDRIGESHTLRGLGQLAKRRGRLGEALQFFQRALVIAEEQGQRKAAATCLDHAGVVLTELDRPAEAVERHRRALELRKQVGLRYEESFTHIGLSLAYEKLGKLDDAATEMATILDPIEAASRRLSLGRFRAALYGNLRSHHERYIGLLAKLHRHVDAFDASERSRARLTLDSVQEELARGTADPDAALLVRAGALRDKIDQAERDRDRIIAAGEPAEHLREIGARIESLLFTLNETEQQVRAAYPGLAEARDARPFTSAQIRSRLLDGETALIEYFLGDKRSFRWTLTRDGLSLEELPGRGAIEPLATNLHGLLSKGDQRTLRHQVELAAKRLSGVVLAGIVLPESIRRVVIVADGALHYVPFAILPHQGARLIDRFEVSVAPSASALLLMRRMTRARGPAEERLVVIADPVFQADDPRVRDGKQARPRTDADVLRAASEAGIVHLVRLPATRLEAKAIVRLGGSRVRTALDFDASRQRVLDGELSDSTILHFASHALINPRHHGLSGIILSLVDEHGQPIDGFVRVHDLYRLHLRAELVVLSACRTAIGTDLRGEGLVGLVSGFLWAGAPRVIASFWDVKDQATAAFMMHFYRALLVDRMPAGAALRRAQLAVKRDPRWSSPYYWGAFTLHGEWK